MHIKVKTSIIFYVRMMLAPLIHITIILYNSIRIIIIEPKMNNSNNIGNDFGFFFCFFVFLIIRCSTELGNLKRKKYYWSYKSIDKNCYIHPIRFVVIISSNHMLVFYVASNCWLFHVPPNFRWEKKMLVSSLSPWNHFRKFMESMQWRQHEGFFFPMFSECLSSDVCVCLRLDHGNCRYNMRRKEALIKLLFIIFRIPIISSPHKIINKFQTPC